MSGYVGRLAPSPTGALHLGNVRTFMIAWLRARHEGGKVIFCAVEHKDEKTAEYIAAGGICAVLLLSLVVTLNIRRKKKAKKAAKAAK